MDLEIIKDKALESKKALVQQFIMLFLLMSFPFIRIASDMYTNVFSQFNPADLAVYAIYAACIFFWFYQSKRTERFWVNQYFTLSDLMHSLAGYGIQEISTVVGTTAKDRQRFQEVNKGRRLSIAFVIEQPEKAPWIWLSLTSGKAIHGIKLTGISNGNFFEEISELERVTDKYEKILKHEGLGEHIIEPHDRAQGSFAGL